MSRVHLKTNTRTGRQSVVISIPGIRLDGSLCIGTSPVTREVFACFIRTGARETVRERYVAHQGDSGGDAALERIQFSWEQRLEPVTNLTWYEAQECCAWLGGRLPKYNELAALASNQLTPPCCASLAEWCVDSYGVARMNQILRRIMGGPVSEKAPHMHAANLGFRVAFETASNQISPSIELQLGGRDQWSGQ
jgi:hypothetical protein